MKLTKSIIAEMVSYIDFADIREFVKNYPQLVEAEETINKFIVDSFRILTRFTIKWNYKNEGTSKNVKKFNKFEFIQLEKGVN